MEPTISALAKLYELNTGLFQKALSVFEPDQIFLRPEEKANSAHWVAGHMVTSRFTVANSIGMTETAPWGDIFEFGSEIKDESEYPPLEEIKKAWDEVSAKLTKHFSKVTEETLQGPPPFEPPGMEKNVRGILSFMYMHETYHLGQLGYLARLHGHGRLFG